MDFEDYVAARGPALLRFAYVLTADHHRAEDLAQAALADAFRHWGKVQRAEHPDAYVRRMLLNRHLGWRRLLSSTELVRASPPEPLPADDHAESVAASDEAWQALAQLPARPRAVLALRYLDDMGDEQIAAVLGITVSTVRSTASRALRTLRQTMTEHASSGGETP